MYSGGCFSGGSTTLVGLRQRWRVRLTTISGDARAAGYRADWGCWAGLDGGEEWNE